MIELGIGADLVRLIGWLIWIAILGLIVIAIRKGKSWRVRLFQVGMILAVISALFIPNAYRKWEGKKRYQAAKAVFDERCRTSPGTKIHKTVDDVEGVLLLDIRAPHTEVDRHDPNWPDAGLPRESSGNDFILNFLYWEYQQRPPKRGYLRPGATIDDAYDKLKDGWARFPGYAYVDVKQPEGVQRYRLVGRDLLKEPSPVKLARYAVSFRNIEDPVGRAHWVAGLVVTITDTSNGEVIAEKTWYSFEPGLGSTAGARTPWGFAYQCQVYRGWTGGEIRMFVDQVLKPKQIAPANSPT